MHALNSRLHRETVSGEESLWVELPKSILGKWERHATMNGYEYNSFGHWPCKKELGDNQRFLYGIFTGCWKIYHHTNANVIVYEHSQDWVVNLWTAIDQIWQYWTILNLIWLFWKKFSEGVRYFLNRYKKTTIIPGTLAMSRFYEFHFRSEVNVWILSQRLSVRIVPLICIGEN